METGDTKSSVSTIESSSNVPSDRPTKRQREEGKDEEIDVSTKPEDTKCPAGAQSPEAKKIRLESADDQHKDGSRTIPIKTRSDVQSEGNKRSHEDSVDTPGETPAAKAPRLDSTWSEVRYTLDCVDVSGYCLYWVQLSAIEEGEEEEGKKRKKTRNHSKRRKESMPKKLNDMNLKVMAKYS